jgi:hypothetical protein
MKLRNVAYIVSTAIMVLVMGGGGVTDILHTNQVVTILTHLGYPLYFGTLLGIWKVLSVIALVAPKFPRLKEWAYAGIFIDLTGAAFSHTMSGDGIAKIMVPVVLVAIAMTSWALRPESRRLGELPFLQALTPCDGR